MAKLRKIKEAQTTETYIIKQKLISSLSHGISI